MYKTIMNKILFSLGRKNFFPWQVQPSQADPEASATVPS